MKGDILKLQLGSLQAELKESQAQVTALKQGICEHVATNELRAGCRLCDLALAEKTVTALREEVEDLKDTLNNGSEVSMLQSVVQGKKLLIKELQAKLSRLTVSKVEELLDKMMTSSAIDGDIAFVNDMIDIKDYAKWLAQAIIDEVNREVKK